MGRLGRALVGESLACRFVDMLIVGLCEMGNVWCREGHGVVCVTSGWCSA